MNLPLTATGDDSKLTRMQLLELDYKDALKRLAEVEDWKETFKLLLESARPDRAEETRTVRQLKVEREAFADEVAARLGAGFRQLLEMVLSLVYLGIGT